MNTPPPAPLDAAVQEILRQSPVGPLLGKPIDQVLASIGAQLPQFPVLAPLPGMPPIPALDPVLLLKPITDMMGQFGTGKFDPMAGVNPQQVLSQVVSGLTQVMSLGMSAVGMLAGLAGQGAQNAAGASTSAVGDAGEISTQATQIDGILAQAATAVQVGNAELAAIAAKFVATAAALAAVPGGQPAIAAAAAESAAESAAVVAQTRCELEACKAEMECAGQPCAVTQAPSASPAAASSPTAAPQGQQLIQQLTQLVQPVQQLGKTLTEQARKQDVRQQGTHHAGALGAAGVLGTTPAHPVKAHSGGRAVPGGSVPHQQPQVLRPFQQGGVRVGAISSTVALPLGVQSASTVVEETVTTATATSGMSMVPPVGPLAMARAASEDDEMHSHVAAGSNSADVVSVVEAMSAPVVGENDRLEEPPDKALTL